MPTSNPILSSLRCPTLRCPTLRCPTLRCPWPAALVLVALLSAACRPAPRIIEITRVVTQTVVEEGQLVEVTRLVPEVREIVASPTPPPPVTFVDPDPSIFIQLAGADVETMDPALAYDLASTIALQNIYESVITYGRSDSDSYFPALAEVVPSVENGLIAADGLTYTFPIRRGVGFHDGGTLEAHDVAYSLRRQLLQSDPTGPAWLFLEPILGVSDVTQDIADGQFVGDSEGLRANTTPEELSAACERVLSAVAFDDEESQVTITLARPWEPFMATMPMLGVVDQEWAIANGAWDGSCDTWADHYAPGPDGSTLNAVANGTGSYRLARWVPDEEYVLEAFEGYWRTEETALWGDGPYGPARIPTVLVRPVPEWITRFTALAAGDADYVTVPFDSEAQVDPLVGEMCDYHTGECAPNPDNPEGVLRKWDALPTVGRQDLFMNQAVGPDSPYIGSGRLDGNGIPPDFFADVDVRRAMATCFDYDTFNADVLGGEGIRNNGPIITGMLGYNPDGPIYTYDPDACAAHLAAAWGGALAENGFRLNYVYPAPLFGGTQMGAILQNTLAAIDERYVVELVGLPPPAFFRGMFAGQFPLFAGGWIEDIHDPHNWAAPYTVGSIGASMGLPDELRARFASLVNAGALTADPARRELIYHELQQLFHEEVPAVILFQRPSFRIEPRYVNGFAFRPGMVADGPLFYTLSTK